MRKPCLATACLTALALAGCAISPDPSPQTMVVPVAWKALPAPDDTLDQPVRIAWWHIYDDVTLDRIMAQAHVANTDVRLASTRVAQAWGQC